MPISTDQLNEGEEVLVDVHPHGIVLAAPTAVTVVAIAVAASIVAKFPHAPMAVAYLLLAMVAVPAGWLVKRAAVRQSVSLVVTDQRILLTRGILRRDVTQLRLSRVADVHCTQTLGERLIGSGRLVLEMGGDEENFVVDDVRRPQALQRVIGSRLRVTEVPDDEVPAADDHPTPPQGVRYDPGADRAPTPAAAPDSERVVSVHRQLVEIDDLRRRGILTDEEFERKKADLLSRL